MPIHPGQVEGDAPCQRLHQVDGVFGGIFHLYCAVGPADTAAADRGVIVQDLHIVPCAVSKDIGPVDSLFGQPAVRFKPVGFCNLFQGRGGISVRGRDGCHARGICACGVWNVVNAVHNNVIPELWRYDCGGQSQRQNGYGGCGQRYEFFQVCFSHMNYLLICRVGGKLGANAFPALLRHFQRLRDAVEASFHVNPSQSVVSRWTWPEPGAWRRRRRRCPGTWRSPGRSSPQNNAGRPRPGTSPAVP